MSERRIEEVVIGEMWRAAYHFEEISEDGGEYGEDTSLFEILTKFLLLIGLGSLH